MVRCVNVVVPEAAPATFHPQAVPDWKAASVSMRLRVAADLMPTCLVNKDAVRAENTALVMRGNRSWSV